MGLKCNDLRLQLQLPVTSFTKEVYERLAKRPLIFNGRLANRQLTSLIKEATGVNELIYKFPFKLPVITHS